MAQHLDSPENSDDRPRWRPRDVVFATLTSAIVFGLLVVIAAKLSGIVDERGTSSIPTWTLAAFYAVLVATVWYFSVRKYRVGWRSLGFRAPEGRWSFALAALVLLASLTLFAAYKLTTDQLPISWLRPPEISPELFGHGFERVLNGLAIVVVAPVAEEVFFRGFVLGGLVAALGDLRAAVVSSALFAVMHASVGTFVPLFAAGMLLAWLYLRTRSIWPPIAAHSTQNALAMLSPG